jgi:hypothetical protein
MEGMKSQPSSEFERFNRVMDGLLAVSHKELQAKLDEEKRLKAARKKRAKALPASRASDDKD